MRFLFSFIGIVFFLLPLSAQSYSELLAEAQTECEAGKFRRAGKLYAEAFEIRSPRSDELHQAVAAWAQAGKENEAFEILNFGIRSGWITMDRLLSDPALVPLRTDERWELATQQLALYSFGNNAEIREQLSTISERDQYYRLQIQDIVEEHGWQSPVIKEMNALQREVDLINLGQIDSLITQHGYPGRTLAGVHGSTALLVIQRANLETQLKYLDILTEAANNYEILWSDLAIMIDGIKMRQGKPQVYGTQVTRGSDGMPAFYAIEDPENINARRREAGLMPMEEYAAKFGLIWKQ